MSRVSSILRTVTIAVSSDAEAIEIAKASPSKLARRSGPLDTQLQRDAVSAQRVSTRLVRRRRERAACRGRAWRSMKIARTMRVFALRP